MSAGISSIALMAPIVASNAVFSFRRSSKGLDAMDENPVYGAMNLDIAAGQVLKGGRAAKAIAIASGVPESAPIAEPLKAVKTSVKFGKFMNGVGKVIDFTADNINPIICVTSGIKVLNSDDKTDAAAREALALSAMFSAEAMAKSFLGMPVLKKVDGKVTSVDRAGLYNKSPFLKSQAKAIQDFCETKKFLNKYSLKYLPGILKGLGFVCASILGYQLGTYAADSILGKEQEN